MQQRRSFEGAACVRQLWENFLQASILRTTTLLRLAAPVLAALVLGGCSQSTGDNSRSYRPLGPDETVQIRERPRSVLDEAPRPSDPYALQPRNDRTATRTERHAGIAQTARDGDIAVREEFEAAMRSGSESSLNLFIARHPDHPLADQARQALQRR